jgi:hypothetical protein
MSFSRCAIRLSALSAAWPRLLPPASHVLNKVRAATVPQGVAVLTASNVQCDASACTPCVHRTVLEQYSRQFSRRWRCSAAPKRCNTRPPSHAELPPPPIAPASPRAVMAPRASHHQVGAHCASAPWCAQYVGSHGDHTAPAWAAQCGELGDAAGPARNLAASYPRGVRNSERRRAVTEGSVESKTGPVCT